MPHILFVCTANICRSPVGEGLLRHLWQQRRVAGWSVGSAGTWAVTGQPASPYSVQVMAERGIDISRHRSRKLNDQLLQQTSLVLCMEWRHVATVQAEFPAHAAKIFTLGQMSGAKGDVADPYGSPLANYRKMAAEVAALLDAGYGRMMALAGENTAGGRAEITTLQ